MVTTLWKISLKWHAGFHVTLPCSKTYKKTYVSIEHASEEYHSINLQDDYSKYWQSYILVLSM